VTTESVSATYELPRRLGVTSVAMLLVGITIGSRIFCVPSTAVAEIDSVGGVAFVWLAAIASIFAEYVRDFAARSFSSCTRS